MNAHGISIETPWGDWVQLGHGPRFTILWERGENIGINIGSQSGASGSVWGIGHNVVYECKRFQYRQPLGGFGPVGTWSTFHKIMGRG